MNGWMAWIMTKMMINPSSCSSLQSDLCRNYQIMSTLMIVIITCVANQPFIRRTYNIELYPVPWEEEESLRDHKLSTPFPESIKW